MNSLQEITDEYMTYSVRSDIGYPFPVLKPPKALEFVTKCLCSGYKLMGIEGFIFHQTGAIQPDQSLSFDISDYKAEEEKDFYRDVGGTLMSNISENDLVFEIVFSSMKND